LLLGIGAFQTVKPQALADNIVEDVDTGVTYMIRNKESGLFMTALDAKDIIIAMRNARTEPTSGGTCYGMSLTAILDKKGQIPMVNQFAIGRKTLKNVPRPVDDQLKGSASVPRGMKIGTAGNTGRSSNPHLHFAIHTSTGSNAHSRVSHFTPYFHANRGVPNS